GDVAAVFQARMEQAAGVLRQEIHGEVDALELAAGHEQIARHGRAAAQDDGVEFVEKLRGGVVDADFAVGDEVDAFGLHEVDAAGEVGLVVEVRGGGEVHPDAAN